MAGMGVMILRPPVFFSPFTESELQTALWAKEHLDTYQINYIDSNPLRSYWLAMGLWRENLANEWFQWIPAGVKLGPPTVSDWLNDPDWSRYLYVRDIHAQPIVPARILYQNGNSAIVEKELPVLISPSPSHISVWHFNTAIKLLGWDMARTTYKPGETITVTTYIETIYPPPHTTYWRLELSDRNDQVLISKTGDPFANKFPLQRWSPGRFAREQWSLTIDRDLTPGVYDLRLGLFRRDNGEELDAWFTDPVSGAVLSNKKPLFMAPLARIKIPLTPPSSSELAAATFLETRIGDAFALTRYALQFDSTTRIAHLALYWQALAKTEKDYTAFVHILDAENKVVAQKDAEPRDGNYPTSMWDAQEIVQEQYDLVIPADARAPFSIEIGMYSQPDLKRLPVGNTDRILLQISDF
jgi:hypothetical protein